MSPDGKRATELLASLPNSECSTAFNKDQEPLVQEQGMSRQFYPYVGQIQPQEWGGGTCPLTLFYLKGFLKMPIFALTNFHMCRMALHLHSVRNRGPFQLLLTSSGIREKNGPRREWSEGPLAPPSHKWHGHVPMYSEPRAQLRT